MSTKRALLLFICFLIETSLLNAQSLSKEARNSFALYTKTEDFSHLEKAKKYIDDGYKTKKDSASYRLNLIRSMIYSTLASVDTSRKIKYAKDPISEAELSLRRLHDPKQNDQFSPEIDFCKKQLGNAYLIRANTRLAKSDYQNAYNDYLHVDSVSPNDFKIKHNLAVLSVQLKHYDSAIAFYQKFISEDEHSAPEYFLVLSKLFETKNDYIKSVRILQQGHARYPKNKDLVFKLINIFKENKDYNAISSVIDDAINIESTNSDLYYLAGFTYENLGRQAIAETYYKKIVEIQPNSYDGNYALGLLYLNLYLRNGAKQESLTNVAEIYLAKASEIDPKSVDALKCLTVLYKNTGNIAQLEKVNDRLNQIIN